MTMKLNRIAVVGLMLFAASANAGYYSCPGTVTYLGIHNNGTVAVSLGTGPIIYVCNMDNSTGYTMNTTTCKATYSTLVTAKTIGMSVGLDFNNASSCATMTAWGAYDLLFVNGPN